MFARTPKDGWLDVNYSRFPTIRHIRTMTFSSLFIYASPPVWIGVAVHAFQTFSKNPVSNWRLQVHISTYAFEWTGCHDV